MKFILSTVLVALALACAPARAQTPADAAGQQACGNDAFALCGDAIPDRGRIEACLRRNFRRVSSACRTYMASYGRAHRAARTGHHRYRHHRVVRRHHAYRHKPVRHPTRRHHYSD
jgi:hypothetical protein